ncbi:MAG: ATP-binding cassette domain-containing protein [Alphaproteobacteria bacterium]|nr:ATP-binding cassette domain-containing protein [Alphaproteobacteria bacterium]TAD91960.1 MAG: ATP-binding cassette domain-containing protein [Alphaproteobacteria bacterium]
MTAKLSLRDVTKSFGSKTVLAGVTVDVQPGESLVIIGGSGTGKSVTLKCILGLLEADGGSIHCDGREITHARGAERAAFLSRIGMLFQGAALFDSLPVWQNVAFGLIQGRGMAALEAKDVALTKLAAVGLGPEVAALFPSELSGGMQKRVSLARAIATDPEILFFDEPTTGLDPIMADVINSLIRDRVDDLGATAISITHDMASVRKIATKVAMLYQGRIIWCGPVEEIDHSGNAFVDQFIHGRADGPIRMAVRAG